MVTTQRHCTQRHANIAPSSFGFRVRSSEKFKLLRTGGANGMLDVRLESTAPPARATEALLEWTLKGSPDVSAKLHLDENVYHYWISDAGWYRVDPVGRSIDIPEGVDDLVREHRLWGVPALLCAMQRGDFFLHAAAVEFDKGSLLFAAPGRHGKTTLAMAFHRQGYRVISEDSACCRLTPAPALLPGPAMMRIRPDVFDGRAPNGTRIAAVYDDRIYLVIDENRRGSDDPVPIQALVLLRESANGVHLERMPPHKALPDLWALSFRFPNDADRARCFKQLSGLAASIPVWNLYRPLRLDSLGPTVDRIVEVFG
jgi:hypothetical protein